jgi:hypothetical protein
MVFPTRVRAWPRNLVRGTKNLAFCQNGGEIAKLTKKQLGEPVH